MPIPLSPLREFTAASTLKNSKWEQDILILYIILPSCCKSSTKLWSHELHCHVEKGVQTTHYCSSYALIATKHDVFPMRFLFSSRGRVHVCICLLKVLFVPGTFENTHGFQLYLYIVFCFTSQIYYKMPKTVTREFLFYYWLRILVFFWHSLNINSSHLERKWDQEFRRAGSASAKS